ncbi:PLP-dependent transferase [Meira miltonrushii]|uniref:PLP-dependent transferase n=1 Tax=Meira miltonrushii TaxID=1280837 RepID=A0A316V9F1_9BASI|nr:PLP-dependent transferase [Meira miltonrushii]PWN34239.1 PLP-dependent transferase [Meira miltonrushii]
MGLARSKALKQDTIKRMQDHGNMLVGSTGSRLLDGNSEEHEQLELRLAQHFSAQSALLFNSGYDANTSMLSVMPQPNDVVLYDELVHASMHDGMRSSRIPSSRRIPFKHNDLDDFTVKVQNAWKACQTKAANVFVAVESVYSMDGDICPLPQLIAILNKHVPQNSRCLIVDEAHAVGLYGLNGSGICEAMGLQDSVDVRLATFGKAFGCSGAAVLCSDLVRLYLINYARPLIYSTALPHPALFTIQAALDLLNTPDGTLRAQHTFFLTHLFIERLHGLMGKVDATGGSKQVQLPSDIQKRLESNPSFTGKQKEHPLSIPQPPIVPILTSHAHDLAKYLVSHGYLVRPIVYPTVPRGSERVRICIHAHNTQEQVFGLTECVAKWIEDGKVITEDGFGGQVEKAKL